MAVANNLKALEEYALAEYAKFLRTHLGDVQGAVKATAKGASLSFTLSVRQRKDEDYDVIPNGRANIPWNGDTGKAKLEGGQLTLF
jgi:hypothetical protein